MFDNASNDDNYDDMDHDSDGFDGDGGGRRLSLNEITSEKENGRSIERPFVFGV